MTPGETVSHYRILSFLGAGGMGEVHKAEDTRRDYRVEKPVSDDLFRAFARLYA